MIGLAAHDRIVAVKDAKGNLAASSVVMAATDLAYYAGDDVMTLPLLSVGGVGVVGTSTHFSGARTAELIRRYEAGDVVGARAIHTELLSIYTGVFRAQGVVMVKAGLALQGRPMGSVRLPLLEATEHEISHLRADLVAAGLPAAP